MRVAIAVVFLAFATLAAFADDWLMPEEATYTSSDGKWTLTITPKDIKGHRVFFRDRVNEPTDPGTMPVVPENYARARLQKDGVSVAEWRLVNEVAPVHALVANDGTVATFDNWHSAGYGDDVVVLYRNDGSLIAQFGLDKVLRKEDIEKLWHTASSIQWSGKHRIDEEQRVLLLEIVHDEAPIWHIPVQLDTGETPLLLPKLFPLPRS